MKNNKRRLLKELPFENLKKGVVIWRGSRGQGGNYSISNASTYYEQGGSSSNGIEVFTDTEENILDLIWDNEEWFEDADLKHINLVPVTEGVLLRFKSIDRAEKEELMKGLRHILPHLMDGNYVWNKFKDITSSISNV